MKIVEKVSPMLAEGREKRIFKLKNNGKQMSKVQFSVYPHSTITNHYILEFQYNGHMGDGGMKREVDTIKNWPKPMLNMAQSVCKLKETAHGNLSYSTEPISSVSLTKVLETAKSDLKKIIFAGGW
jgi:hypothetical protein